MGLARRSIQSSAWNVGSQTLQLAVLFVRSVVLARILSPGVFGIYTFAQSIIGISSSLPAFGLGTAYVHRSAESEHRDALSVYFTLISAFSLLWALLLATGAALLPDRERRWTLWVLTTTTFVSLLRAPAYAVLAKRISFQRPAILNLITALLTTVIAIVIAKNEGGIWSLLSVDIVTAITYTVGYYVVKPVWRPRFAWSWPIVRYFLRFGSRVLFAGLLNRAIDKLDEIWTGCFLGDAALGFYSRAYTFANHPRKVLISPIFVVVAGIYAEVKSDHARLSRIFFLVNALVIRGSFFLSGALLLISPEFVHLVLGEKWLPMLNAFRLMTAYVMLDPIRVTMGNVFPAIGHPEVLVRTRAIQLVVIAIGLVVLGPHYGIEGVALVTTGTMVVGAGTLIWQARRHVELSPVRLFGVPTTALVIGLIAAYQALLLLGSTDLHWRVGIAKLSVFVPAYVAIEFLLERRQVCEILQLLKHLLLQRNQASPIQGDQ
jgi:PST family polysaccharide transporter